jgi:coenzyme F420 hydrogenase subunit beta
LAYVGLPNEIASIRKLQSINHPSVSNINYIFGVFHGETIGFSSIKSILRANKVKDVSQIKSLAFRAGKWPGNLRIELKNGKTISIPKFYANYLIPSHITKYSLFQVDYTSELADISVGDAWAPVYENRKQGWSVVIARTQKGLDLIEEMKNNKAVILDEISENDFIKMHSHGLDLKKRGAFIRIEKRKKKGLPVPFYGYEPINISSKRKTFETMLGIMFKIFQAKITIRILEKLPVKLMGWAFIKARNIWKKSTKPTKKSGLTELRFKIINK